MSNHFDDGYGYWDILFTDSENRSAEHMKEQISLVTKAQAERVVKSWQACNWTEGRKYFCRQNDVPVKV